MSSARADAHRTPDRRVLLITPMRDEAEHIVRTARSLQRQTRPPDLWLAVDDGSRDATPDLLAALAGEIPFMRVLSMPADPTRTGPDRLALAAEARAFKWALGTVNAGEYTHIGKLDADVELPAGYFETLLARFAAEPDLGIAGGVLQEQRRGTWWTDRVPGHHVRGALKLYTRECYEAIGGIEEQLGWDTIDETYARMRGFRTQSFPDIVARHHRPVGSADGALRGRARHGQCAYVLHYGLGWVVLRSFKEATNPPFGLSGVAFLYGYLRSAARRESRVDDSAFRRFTRRELRTRLRGVPISVPASGKSSPASSPFMCQNGRRNEEARTEQWRS